MHDMKDSGVEWIGAVPSGYRTASIGSLFTIKKDIIGREPETVLSITQTGIRPKDLSSNEGQNASSYAHYQIVNMGDFAMNHMDLLTGWIDISKYEGVTSPDYRVFTLNDKEMSADYFLRVFQYYYTNKVFFGFGQGVATLGRWRLPAINFKKIDVPVPPVLEQQRIVSAIDEKVGKVDALIANVQTQIEKLKAYKQSMITEVVTKGLDPSVPMKNSGVDVYPSVPEHWNVQKTLTTLTMPITDGPHTTPELLSEGIPFVSAEAVSCGNGGIDFDHIRGFISREFYDECSKKYVPQRDDIYMIKSGATTGRVSVVDTDRIFRFLYYFLQSSAYQRQVQFGWTYGTQQNIGMRTLERLKVFVPPLDEQYAITECLDAKCIQIDRLVAIKQAKIEKLEQYKKSLIYEYVTGKREVM